VQPVHGYAIQYGDEAKTKNCSVTPLSRGGCEDARKSVKRVACAFKRVAQTYIKHTDTDTLTYTRIHTHAQPHTKTHTTTTSTTILLLRRWRRRRCERPPRSTGAQWAFAIRRHPFVRVLCAATRRGIVI